MEVTLDLLGSLKVALFTPDPDDEAVKLFLSSFKSSLRNKAILAIDSASRTWEETCAIMEGLPKSGTYNCLLIVCHGTPDHKLSIKDSYGCQLFDFLRDPKGWSNFFHYAIDDKLIITAVCHSGEEMNTKAYLHTGLGLSVLTPSSKIPKLKIVDGSKAIAHFLDFLADKNIDKYSPEILQDAADAANLHYPDVLKLWKYEADPEFKRHMEDSVRTIDEKDIV